MTKEEIKKEAIQYAIDYPTSYGNGYKHKDLRIAYLAGAEPREKHIEELEKELGKVEGFLEDEKMEYCELENLKNNEIAELKAYNEKLLDGDIEKHNKIVELKEQVDALANVNIKAQNIIGKAKEIIQNLLRVTYGEGWNYSLDWKVKAEQFLKE